MRSTSVRVMAVAAVSALLFTSCGGSDAIEPGPYTESMCNSVNDWVTAIRNVPRDSKASHGRSCPG